MRLVGRNRTNTKFKRIDKTFEDERKYCIPSHTSVEIREYDNGYGFWSEHTTENAIYFAHSYDHAKGKLTIYHDSTEIRVKKTDVYGSKY